MSNPIYIASCSFGKDSIATILLALIHKEPLDRVVFSEVMFDNERGISGEIPEHIEWVYSTAIPKLQGMGVKVDVVRSNKDYVYFFQNAVRGGRYKGKLYGFPIGGMCVINRECKINPIHAYYKHFKDRKIIQYIGIASDEPKRLARLKGNQVSLLDKYGYTESMAMELCSEYNLASPLYSMSCRGGCWFCMNRRLAAYQEFRHAHPDLWRELLRLSATPNLCSHGFKYGMTVEQVNAKLDEMDSQLLLF